MSDLYGAPAKPEDFDAVRAEKMADPDDDDAEFIFYCVARFSEGACHSSADEHFVCPGCGKKSGHGWHIRKK